MYKCPKCLASALGTRFATFSYRKALDFPMHERSWDSAEKLLWDAKTWVFIGYSLPAADYEFKLLLKRVQLSRPTPPDIVLITGGSSANETVLSYKKFFRPRSGKVFKDGLTSEAKELFEDRGSAILQVICHTEAAAETAKITSSHEGCWGQVIFCSFVEVSTHFKPVFAQARYKPWRGRSSSSCAAPAMAIPGFRSDQTFHGVGTSPA